MAELVTQSGKVANPALTNLGILDSADIVSIANNTSAATAVFDTLDSLPTTGLSAGQQAFVNGNNRLYISNGTGWYNLTFVNRTPTWFTEPDATYEITDSATPLVIVAKATDSDNSDVTLVNQSVVSDSAQYMVDVSNDSSVWTFTPKSADSIGIEVAAGNLTDSNGDFIYTFKWSDGINFVSKAATISYSPTGGYSGPSYWSGTRINWNGSGQAIHQYWNGNPATGTQIDLSQNLHPPGSYHGAPSGSFKFSPDGTYFVHAGYNQTKTRIYTLNTPWDLTSGSTGYTEYTHPASIKSFDMHISEDGTKYYIAQYNDGLLEHTLSTPWDASTISLVRTVTTQASSNQTGGYYGIGGIHLSPNGQKLVLSSQGTDQILVYDLGTPWALTGLTSPYVYTIPGGSGKRVRGIIASADGMSFFWQYTDAETVVAVDVTTAFDLSTTSNAVLSRSVTTDNNGMGFDIAADASGIFYGSYTDDKIWKF